MSDIQTCLASFAVASGAQTEVATQSVDRAIEAYLAGTMDDRLKAMTALKEAFEAMMLDGRVASHISSRIDEALTTQSRPTAGGCADLDRAVGPE